MQDSGLYQADLSSVENTTLKDIDRYALDSYLKKVYGRRLEEFGDNMMQFGSQRPSASCTNQDIDF